jgi:hypothetical protein
MIHYLHSTGKKMPPLNGLAGPGGCVSLESIMTDKQLVWQQANKQAEQIGKLKNKKAKSRQVVLLCETLKLALKGGK